VCRSRRGVRPALNRQRLLASQACPSAPEARAQGPSARTLLPSLSQRAGSTSSRAVSTHAPQFKLRVSATRSLAQLGGGHARYRLEEGVMTSGPNRRMRRACGGHSARRARRACRAPARALERSRSRIGRSAADRVQVGRGSQVLHPRRVMRLRQTEASMLARQDENDNESGSRVRPRAGEARPLRRVAAL
jgi:hypothetical protein